MQSSIYKRFLRSNITQTKRTNSINMKVDGSLKHREVSNLCVIFIAMLKDKRNL